jgi:hypothetical protein
MKIHKILAAASVSVLILTMQAALVQASIINTTRSNIKNAMTINENGVPSKPHHPHIKSGKDTTIPTSQPVKN